MQTDSEIEYPYLWDDKTDEDLENAFEDLKEYELQLVEKDYVINNMTVNGVNQWDKTGLVVEVGWEVSDTISSFFNQQVRVRCKRKDEKMSPKQYWDAHADEIIDEASAMQGGATISNLDKLMWEKVRGCGTFRPSLMTGWAKKLLATSILDFSAGWQDRLIGAIAAGIPYVGVDPNLELVDSFNDIVERFAPDSGDKYILVPEPFQTCELPDRMYDFVFTSPPYFDLEEYSNDSTQSVRPGDSVNDWLIAFMFPSLDKAWGALSVGGHMMLAINNTTTDKYVDIMIQYMKLLTSIEVAIFPYVSGNDKAQPCWLWLSKKPNEGLGPMDLEVPALQWAIEKYLTTLNKPVVYAGESMKLVADACAQAGVHLTVFANTKVDLGDARVVVIKSNTRIVKNEARKYAARSRALVLDLDHPIIQYLASIGSIPEDSLEPKPLRVLDFEVDGKRIHVLQDHYLEAGTKQRAIQAFADLKAAGYDEVVSYGTPFGYSQVATGYMGKAVSIKTTMFLETVTPLRPETKQAMRYGLNVKLLPAQTKNSGKKAAAEQYVQEVIKAGGDPILVDLGLDDPVFIDAIADNIRQVKGDINPKRIWVAGGSGTLARALAKVWPDAMLLIVTVSTRPIYDDVLEQLPHYKLYKSAIKYTQDADVLPPYESVPHYDAKVWKFVLEDGRDGDYVWNVK